MSNTITGTIKVIGTTSRVSDKFRKREIVITDNTNPQYPQHINCQVSQDKCEMLDQYNVGDNITASYNLRGREWTSPQGEVKYFNTIELWKIVGSASTTQTPQEESDFEKYTKKGATSPANADTTVPFQDLPF